jgi:hypothetical protein
MDLQDLSAQWVNEECVECQDHQALPDDRVAQVSAGFLDQRDPVVEMGQSVQQDVQGQGGMMAL